MRESFHFMTWRISNPASSTVLGPPPFRRVRVPLVLSPSKRCLQSQGSSRLAAKEQSASTLATLKADGRLPTVAPPTGGFEPCFFPTSPMAGLASAMPQSPLSADSGLCFFPEFPSPDASNGPPSFISPLASPRATSKRMLTPVSVQDEPSPRSPSSTSRPPWMSTPQRNQRGSNEVSFSQTWHSDCIVPGSVSSSRGQRPVFKSSLGRFLALGVS